MRNIKIVLIVVFVLLMIFLGIFYFTLYTSFTESTLSFIEIQFVGDSQDSVLGTSNIYPGKYQLSKEEKTLLLQSLDLNSDNIAENYNLVLNDGTNQLEEKTLFHFSMRLVNRFKQEKKYNLYLENQSTAFIETEDSFYEIADNDFYYSHRGFDPYYKIKYLPKIELGEDVFFGAGNPEFNWQIKRYDGSTIQNSRDVVEINSLGEEEISLLLENEEDHIKVLFNEMPNEVTYTILNIDTKEEVKMGVLNQVEYVFLPIPRLNGDYHYQLEVCWDKEIPRKSLVSFPIEVSLPITFSVESTTIFQDEIIEITASRTANLEDITIEGAIVGDLQWHREDQQLRTVIASNYHTDPGIYSIKLKDMNHEKTHSYDLEILPRDYKTQYLTIDPTIEERTRNQEAYEERDQYFTPVRKTSSEIKYYDDEFLLPTEGRLTTEFGERRYVNDELTSYRHNGIDIASPTGTEVLATNHGEVVFEREMILMGNTIVIDHGHGLFSTYMHLDKIQVDTGDWIEKGNIIGTVGTTGFSTGPHLHFTLSYYDTPIEPGYFIIGKPYTKEDHYQIRR